jgi:hypothetical protein
MDSVMVTAGRRLTKNDRHPRLRETEPIVERNQERVGQPVAVEDGILTQYNTVGRSVFAVYLINLINWLTICDENLYCHLQRMQALQQDYYNPPFPVCLWILAHRQNLPRILSSDEAHLNLEGINSTRNPHLWSLDKPHGTSEGTFQRRLSVNVWCYLIRDPFNLEQCLTAANYLHFLTKELSLLMENVPLDVSWRLFFQSHGAPPHFASQVVT